MRVKILDYEVSNWTSIEYEGDYKSESYQQDRRRLDPPEWIEEDINRFCSVHDVVDIKVNTVEVQYHNNGRGNTVKLIYTIMYNEEA